MRRSLFAAAACQIAAVILTAQQAPDRQPFRSGRAVMTIDASVRAADGSPITDLHASDFTVRVDGEPRTVLAVRRFGDNGPAANQPSPIGRFLRSRDAASGFVVVVVVDRESISRGNEHNAVEAVASMIEGLSAADGVAAVAVPGAVVDVTRDRGAVAAALRTMTGTRPIHDWIHHLSWTEAIAFERSYHMTVQEVLRRECPPNGPSDPCPADVRNQAHEMVVTGRAHAAAILDATSSVLEQLEMVRAPKRLVLLSGGIPVDEELLSKYRGLADLAARAHVALSVVQIDQPSVNVADAYSIEQMAAGPEYDTGLANVASVTGGTFAHVVATGTGVFDRIKSDVRQFYQIGVESRPSDADGKPHRVDVRVGRPHATVVSPSATAVAPATANQSAIERALRQPLPVSELAFDAAFYATHSSDRGKVRVIVAARTEDGSIPQAWGFALLDAGHVVEGRTVTVQETSAGAWTASATADVPPGRYEVRVAAVDDGGRVGVIDAVAPIGLRSAGTTNASDLIVGTIEDGTLRPRATIRADEPSAAMIEISAPTPLGGVRASLQLSRSSEAAPRVNVPLALRTRTGDRSVIVAEGPLDLRELPPGTYNASALLERDGKTFARISRIIEVEEGSPSAVPLTARAMPNVVLRPANRVEADTIAVMERVGSYIEQFGERASVLVAIEHYRQESSRTYQTALPSGRGGTRGGLANGAAIPVATTKSTRRLTSEIALVRNAAAVGGWLGFRAVVEADGKAAGDPDRLRALFGSGVPDIEAAKRISEESTRYNVGPVKRTFNVPTATLFFFTPQNLPRFTFHHDGHERIDGVDTWKVDFQETASPTIVMNGKGKDVPSTGTLWIDPATGRVLRTRLALSHYSGSSSMATVEVVYRDEPAVEMLVPATMREWYSVGQDGITAEASYSDYRRFQTSVRIK